MAWTDDYINIPYKPKGRDFNGCDCGGLVLLVLKDYFKVQAKDAESEYEAGDFDSGPAGHAVLSKALDNAMTEWRKVAPEEVRPGDLVEFAVGGVRCHVGMWVKPGRMLHIDSNNEFSCLADIHGVAWGARFRGYYRHERM